MDPSDLNPMTRPSPDVERARACLEEGDELLSRGRLDEALPLLQEAVRLDPRWAPARNKLGVCHARRGELELARHEFNAAIEIDPRFAPAYSNLGNLHQEAGRLEEAVAAYQQALQLDPDYPVAHHNLGVVYKRMGRIRESVHHLKRAARLENQGRLGPGEGTRRPAASRWSTFIWVAILLLLAYWWTSR